MASITHSLPGFLQSCFGLCGHEEHAAHPEPVQADNQVAMASHGPVDELHKGAAKHRSDILDSKQHVERFNELSKGQKPTYYVLTCSDSRVSAPQIFKKGPGEIFSQETLGALMDPMPSLPPKPGAPVPQEWANISYGVEELKVSVLVVKGHEFCGAVAGIMSPEAISHNPLVAAHLAKHAGLRDLVNERYKGLSPTELALAAVAESVLYTRERLLQFAPVKKAVAEGRLQVLAMVYEISNHGLVSQWDPETDEFIVKNPKHKNEVSMVPRRHRMAQA